MRPQKLMAIGSLLISVCTSPAFSQNSFFGSNPNVAPGSPTAATGGAKEDDGAIGPGIPPMNSPTPPAPAGGDYTVDEKRMQHKYKGNINHAKKLIIDGEAMMKASGDNKETKEYKKGKIMKEVGEKSLNDLRANNPFDVDKEKPLYVQPKKLPQ